MGNAKIGVIGGGAWGTAMAHALAKDGNSVEVWVLEPDVEESVNKEHENKRYLPGYGLSENLTATVDLNAAASNKDFLIFASPSLYLASTAAKIADCEGIKDGKTCIGVLTKGFIPSEEGPKFVVETLESVLPACYEKNIVYIAGPSHAEEVAMGKVTGLIAACETPKTSIRFRELLNVSGLMVYSSLDVIGVQVCAAAKNVIAVAFGILDAIAENSDKFGDNAASLLLAAGLNEIQTIGFAMGATHAETFASISGVGDLDVTCRSKFGRNQRFGHDIVQKNILKDFKNLDDLIARIKEVGYLPEGAVACKYVHMLAESRNLKLPICNGLYRILDRQVEPMAFVDEIIR